MSIRLSLILSALLCLVAPRPVAAQAVATSWIYSYDGSGNIRQVRNPATSVTDTFIYDTAGRLVSGMADGNQQNYSYDAFGNRLTADRAEGAIKCVGDTECGVSLSVDGTTNHLLSHNAAYDDAGNVRQLNGGLEQYEYDATGMMVHARSGSDDRQFVYTADDERIAVRLGSNSNWTWTVRDLAGKPLRELTASSLAGATWSKDHIWRDGQLLATVTLSPDLSTSTQHYHLDHLGTPRLITDGSGALLGRHAYYPFGAELNLLPHESPEQLLKFTGHERDLIPGSAQSLDYMHARYYSPLNGRFVSVDPGRDWHTALPQSFNLYAYVRNNPVNATDPNGRQTEPGVIRPMNLFDRIQNPSTLKDLFVLKIELGTTVVKGVEAKVRYSPIHPEDSSLTLSLPGFIDLWMNGEGAGGRAGAGEGDTGKFGDPKPAEKEGYSIGLLNQAFEHTAETTTVSVGSPTVSVTVGVANSAGQELGNAIAEYLGTKRQGVTVVPPKAVPQQPPPPPPPQPAPTQTRPPT